MPDFDISVPNAARIYDYFLGGKDNFAADRDAAEELRRVLPDAEMACHENRDFLRRAVRYLAGEAGVNQFIDIGSGLPTAENTHEVAQAVRPGSRTVYVDYDPVIVGHAHAILGASPNVVVIDGDLRRPGPIIGREAVWRLIDFDQPVAILLVAILHFLHDTEDPHGALGVLKSVMAPGSYLVISHVTQDSVSDEEKIGGLSIYEKASAPIVPRRHAEVLRFFDGMELVEPGLVNVSQWRSSRLPMRQLVYGGVGKKP